MGKGICIAPRHANNLMLSDTFNVTISNIYCRFDKYLYFNKTDNQAAKLFYEEFLNTMANAP